MAASVPTVSLWVLGYNRYVIPKLRLLDHLDIVEGLLKHPPLGLLTDFDGTLSPFAPTPEEAMISPICKEALEALSRKIPLVSVISGRTARDLAQHVGLDQVAYVGNHGMEYPLGDGWQMSPAAAPYLDAVRATCDYLEATLAIPGVFAQNKGPTASVHYRQARDRDEARDEILRAIASCDDARGLSVSDNRLSVEIKSPVDLNKGTAVKAMVVEYGLRSAIFMGDDHTDVDAMKAVVDVGAGNLSQGLSVGVVYDHTPREVLKAANFILWGIEEAERFLAWLEETLS